MVRGQQLELALRRQVGEVGEGSARILFFACVERRAQRIEPRDFGRVERKRRSQLHGAGDPRVLRVVRLDVSCRVRRREAPLVDDDLAILVFQGFAQVPLQHLRLGEQLLASLSQSRRPRGERCIALRSEPFGDGADRGLELTPRIVITAQHGDAQGTQHFRHLVAQHSQCLGRLRSDEDRLALCELMADEIGDGVRLAGTRRPLHDHRPAVTQAADDLDLLFVRLLAEQHFVIVNRRERRKRTGGGSFRRRLCRDR